MDATMADMPQFLDPRQTLIESDPEAPYTLGRAARELDPRNKNYRALVGPTVVRNPTPNRNWYSPEIWDQADSPQCTVEASVGLCRTHPFRGTFSHYSRFDTFGEKRAFYLEIQKHDPVWWGPHDGALVSSPLKEMVSLGMISDYRWLFGEAELREWLTWYGPAKVGVNWHWGMFETDDGGYIHPTGPEAGGHDIRVYYYSAPRQAYRLANSWGKGWGESGRCWLTRQEMDELLQANGEAVTIAVPRV